MPAAAKDSHMPLSHKSCLSAQTSCGEATWSRILRQLRRKRKKHSPCSESHQAELQVPFAPPCLSRGRFWFKHQASLHLGQDMTLLEKSVFSASTSFGWTWPRQPLLQKLPQCRHSFHKRTMQTIPRSFTCPVAPRKGPGPLQDRVMPKGSRPSELLKPPFANLAASSLPTLDKRDFVREGFEAPPSHLHQFPWSPGALPCGLLS